MLKKVRKIAAGALAAVTIGGGIAGGFTPVAMAANNDVAELIDRYGNKVNLDDGFEFIAYTVDELGLTFEQGMDSYIFKASKITDPNNVNGPDAWRIDYYSGDELVNTWNVLPKEEGYGRYPLRDKDGKEIVKDIVVRAVGGTKNERGNIENPEQFILKFDNGREEIVYTDKDSEVAVPNSNLIRVTSDDGDDFTVDKNSITGEEFTVDGGKNVFTFVPFANNNGATLTKINDKPNISSLGFGLDYDTFYKEPQKRTAQIMTVHDLDNLPNEPVYIRNTKIPEQPNSTNLYNLILCEEMLVQPGEKWRVDLSKVNDVVPVEKREYYVDHAEDIDKAYRILFNKGIFGDDTADSTFSSFSPIHYFPEKSIDELMNYKTTDTFTHLEFNKETQGYTATEDFEFLIIVPTEVMDVKTRFNVAIPVGILEYNNMREIYKLKDNPDIVDLEYVANTLKDFLQLTVPTHIDEYKYYNMLFSVTSQIEKTNLMQTLGNSMTREDKGLPVTKSGEELDEYIENIKTNSSGFFEKEAEHLKEVLTKYDWIDGLMDIAMSEDMRWEHGMTEEEEEAWNQIFFATFDNYIKNLQDAGYTHNDFVLMALAASGALLGFDADWKTDKEADYTLKSETTDFYTKLIADLGIEDKVEYTELGIPKVTLKAGETIKFNDCEFFNEQSVPVFIYEKYYDDTEQVVNRTFRIGVDEKGTTNIYKGGGPEEPETPVEEPKEEPKEEQPVEEPKEEKPVEEPKEEPTEPVEEPKEEKPVEEPKEEPKEEPVKEEPKEEPKEDTPVEEPTEQPTEPVKEPTETPIEQPTEQPTEPVEQPTETPTEPVEQPTEPTEEPTVEEPTVIESPIEEPTGEPVTPIVTPSSTTTPDTGDKGNIFVPISILSGIGVLAGIGAMRMRKKED